MNNEQEDKSGDQNADFSANEGSEDVVTKVTPVNKQNKKPRDRTVKKKEMLEDQRKRINQRIKRIRKIIQLKGKGS